MKYIFLFFMTFFVISMYGQEGKKYAVGDIYSEGNVVGIVVKVTDEGRHGMIMSLDVGEGFWSRKPKKERGELFLSVTNATSKDDGIYNMEQIAKFIEQNNLNWEYFPPFHWCRNKGEGWYLPAINELIEINKAFHGGKIEKNREAEKAFNQIIEKNGGKKLNSSTRYFSSTELTYRQVYIIYMEKGILAYGCEESKISTCSVRAVYKF